MSVTKRVCCVLIVAAALPALSACGGDSRAPQNLPVPADPLPASSDWDSLVWDEGNWA